MKRFSAIYLLASTVFFLCVTDAHAQQHRYMDSSGNIHFVDSLSDVPRQYREQLVPPTPTPVLDARQRKELQHRKEREVRDRQRQMEAKKRELERSRQMLQRQQRVQGGTTNTVPAPPKSAAPAVREDQIEVIR
jgi:type IV secretory pathway VirB10-like protein